MHCCTYDHSYPIYKPFLCQVTPSFGNRLIFGTLFCYKRQWYPDVTYYLVRKTKIRQNFGMWEIFYSHGDRRLFPDVYLNLKVIGIQLNSQNKGKEAYNVVARICPRLRPRRLKFKAFCIIYRCIGYRTQEQENKNPYTHP